MDQTFKVFDMMLKHRYKGQLDVDPEYAENACLADYRHMLEGKLQEAQKAVETHKHEWDMERNAKLIELQIKAQEEAELKEEEEKRNKLRELRGQSSNALPEPIEDDETILKKKKAAEEAEAVGLAARALEAKLEADKQQQYETKLSNLQFEVENINAQIEDPQFKGKARLKQQTRKTSLVSFCRKE